MAHDVFISHSSVNKAAADAICHALEANGVRCWIAPRDIPAGTKYGEQITRGLKDCAVFLLIFSDEANKSDPVNKEIERAVLGYQKIAIPFRIEDVPMNDNIEFFLSDSQWIDAVKHGEIHWRDIYPDDTVFQELVTAVKNVLGKPSVESITTHNDNNYGGNTQDAYVQLIQTEIPPMHNPFDDSVKNLVNGGQMAEADGFIYYTKGNGIIYKYPTDGSGGRTEIFKDPDEKHINGLNIQDNTIFFYASEKGICKINLEGSDYSVVKSYCNINPEYELLLPEEMIVLEKSIVLRFNKDFKPLLYIMDFASGEIQCVSDSDEKCAGVTYYDGWLYFSYSSEFEDGSIARMLPDGTGRVLVAEDVRATNLLLDDDYIYFFAFYDANQYRVKRDGTELEKISIDRGNSHFNMNNDFLYYDYGWGVPEQKMYQYKKDGSTNDIIFDVDHNNKFGIYILNEQIYTLNNNILHRMNLDGTNVEKMKM